MVMHCWTWDGGKKLLRAAVNTRDNDYTSAALLDPGWGQDKIVVPSTAIISAELWMDEDTPLEYEAGVAIVQSIYMGSIC